MFDSGGAMEPTHVSHSYTFTKSEYRNRNGEKNGITEPGAATAAAVMAITAYIHSTNEASESIRTGNGNWDI